MKQFLKNLISSKSPESHRRLIVLVFAADFLVIGWYLLSRDTPVSNKELIVLYLELIVATIGGGWITIVADNAFNRKKKSDDSVEEIPPSNGL